MPPKRRPPHFYPCPPECDKKLFVRAGKPAEEFVIDCHMHIDGKEPWMVRQSLDLLFGMLAAYRLDQAIVVDGGLGSLDWLAQVARTDRRFHFMIWMRPEKPDVEFPRQAGAVGVKLHNSPIMAGQFEPGVWDSPEWQRVFAAAEELGMPVLWHVTQVETAAPYIGEGAGNALASRRAKGSTLSNADLLDRFLRIVDRYRGITFVGACRDDRILAVARPALVATIL